MQPTRRGQARPFPHGKDEGRLQGHASGALELLLLAAQPPAAEVLALIRLRGTPQRHLGRPDVHMQDRVWRRGQLRRRTRADPMLGSALRPLNVKC